MIVLWEFRVNPEADATTIFSGVVNIIMYVAIGFLIWRARRAVR